MNREQMVEKANQSLGAGFAAACTQREVAAAVLDAILPQVTTVAELEALPKGTRLLGADGATWQREQSGSWTSDQYLRRHSKTLLTLKKANPLTVVWQPASA